MGEDRLRLLGQAADSQVAATNAKLSEYAAAVGLAALDAWPGDRLRWMRTAQMLRIALIGRPEVRFQAAGAVTG